MIYGSVCSGIEAATVAWEPLGWTAAFFSEIEKFPSAVLAHHYGSNMPDEPLSRNGVPNLSDMAKIDGRQWRGKIDMLVGGTPCQAFSIAGKRKSLDDERGNLTLKFVELCDDIDPGYVVWENVPGVLNTKDNAFGCFLGALAGEDDPLKPAGKKWSHAGYVLGPKRTVAWRLLDAQYFGLAQRRKRIFVVASSGNGADPRTILFESEGVRRDTPPRREAGQEVAGSLTSRASGGGGGPGAGKDEACAGYLQPVVADVASTLNSHFGDKMGLENQHVNEGCPLFVAFAQNQRDEVRTYVAFSCKDYGNDAADNVSPTLRSMNNDKSTPNGGGQMAVASDMAVRRLTPRECERLQGFPDDYTLIPYRGKEAENCPDGPRYKALGNSMAVNVMRWIGARVQRAEMLQ